MSDSAVKKNKEGTSEEVSEISAELSISTHMKYLVNVCKYFYVTYFCLVDVRLKRNTLRSLPLEIILDWELVLGKDGQLVRNNNVGIAIVISMCCRCFFSTYST